MAEQIKQRIVLEGADAIQRQLEAIGKAGSEAFQKLQDASKSVGNIGGEQKLKEAVAAVQQYNKALGESQRSLSQTGRATSDAAAATGKFSAEIKSVATDALQSLGVSARFAESGVNVAAGAITAIGGVARAAAIGVGVFGGAVALALPALTSLGRAATDAINKLAEIGQKTGLSANEVNQFRAQLAGVGVDAKTADANLLAVGKVLDGIFLNSLKAAEGARSNIRSIGQPVPGVVSQLVKIGEGFVTVSRAASEAGKQAAKQSDGLKGLIESTLKLSEAQLNALPKIEVFNRVAAALAKINDENERRVRVNELAVAGLDVSAQVEALRRSGEERRKSLLEITEADKEAAAQAQIAAQVYQQTWDDLVKSLGTSFQGVGAQFDQLKTKFLESIISLSETIRSQGLGAALAQANDTANAGIEQNLFKPIEDFFRRITGGAADAPKPLVEAVKEAAEGVQQIGEAATQAAAPVQELSDGLVQGFTETDAALRKVFEGAETLSQSDFGDNFIAEIDQFDLEANRVADSIENAFTFTDTIAAIGSAFESLWQSVASSAQSALSGIENSVQSILNSVLDAVSQIQSAVSSISIPSVSSDTEGFATGGYIRGRGTSTSDSILARLSNGEYVMRAAAVRKFGPSFFAALNSLRLPQFATGGLAGAMAMPSMSLTPSFELPGSGPALRPLAVTIGGQTFDMMAPEDTAQSLMRFATVKQIRSNGRKPSWHGG